MRTPRPGQARLAQLRLRPQALVQYPDPGSAANAKAALEGHAIYDGGYNRVRARAAAPRAARTRKTGGQA